MSRLRWRDVNVICGSKWDDNRAVSSANVAVITSDGVGRSAVYREYKGGPRRVLCGVNWKS